MCPTSNTEGVAVRPIEGVLQRYKETTRMVIMGEPDKFLGKLKPLLDSNINLHDVIDERPAARKRREVEREKALARVRKAQFKPSTDKLKKSNTKPSTK